MRKILLSFLSAVCMMAWGGQAAWAETETLDGSYTSSGNNTITGTSYSVTSATSLGSSTINNANCVKLKVNSSGNLVFNVETGYKITNISGAYYYNSSSKTTNLTAVTVDNSTSNILSEVWSVPKKDAASSNLELEDLNAEKNVTLTFESTSTQLLVNLTITYERVYYPVSISSIGASTFCVPDAVTIPSGITAYIGSLNEEKTTLTLSQITGTIPANQPVILSGTAGDYKLNLTSAATATKVGSLEGNATAAAVTPSVENATICVLDKVNDNLGFYKWTGEIPAYKAYLPVPTAASAPAIRVVYGDEPGNVTAIESIAAEAGESAPIYTLSGRQVKGQVAPGLYIKGGKKILVK
jgi:hypothetical protein